MEKISDLQEFNSVLSSASRHDQMVIAMFSSSWCGPCKSITPKVEHLAEKEGKRARFVKVDIDKAADVCDEHPVEALPTFRCYVKRKLVGEVVGANYDGLKDLVRKNRVEE